MNQLMLQSQMLFLFSPSVGSSAKIKGKGWEKESDSVKSKIYMLSMTIKK